MAPSKNLTVYCSSSDKLEPRFFTVANAFGQELARRGYTLVYGGGRTGLMGAVARGVHAHKGRVIGVVPGFLRHIELVYEEADELIVTADMRSRKAEMERRADAFIVLPGGLGTLEELAEILSLKVLRQIHKPLIFLNQDGFYNPLLTFIEHLCTHRFAHANFAAMYRIATDVEGVFRHLESPPAGADAGRPDKGDKSDLWMIDRKETP